jgi:hypothetical protein
MPSRSGANQGIETVADGILHVLIARIPAQGIDAFNDYESKVLPLLASHGGVLQRRLRTSDGSTEVHLVWFPTVTQFEEFRNDPRRADYAPRLEGSQASSELLRMYDVI